MANSIGDSHLLNEDTWSRLTLRWSDDSAGARLELAEKTLEQFEAAPLIGQGFGTAIFWTSNSSHNAYLGFMADCGILGSLVLPALMFSIRRADWRFYGFALIFLLWAFFYHDVLANDANFGLIAVAVEADESRENESSEAQGIGAKQTSPRGAQLQGSRLRNLSFLYRISKEPYLCAE